MFKLTIGLLTAIAALIIHNVGGIIEGRIAPVTSALEISAPTPYPPPSYRTKWRGKAKKLRNCRFVRLEWYLGPRNGNHVQVQIEVTDEPRIRETGEIEWEGIVVSLPPDEVLQNSHADFVHSCPYRPWLVRTRVFDSPEV